MCGFSHPPETAPIIGRGRVCWPRKQRLQRLPITRVRWSHRRALLPLHKSSPISIITFLAPPTRHASLLIAGHSRGGHGALTFASKYPDRVLALFVANGWSNRQYYGDANTLFTHDLQLVHMDPALKSIFESTVWENDNLFHASNLCGTPTLLRTSTQDDTVPPFHERKILRALEEKCGPRASVEYSEVLTRTGALVVGHGVRERWRSDDG